MSTPTFRPGDPEEIQNDLPVNGTTQGSVSEQLPPGGEQKYGEMQHYFVRKFVLSMSSCVLTFAYIMLVNYITSKTGRRNFAGGVPYNFCMLSAFLAMVFHVGMIGLSGPGAVLCRHQGDMKGQQRAALFTRIIIACEYLHVGGISLLALAVFTSSFVIFEDLVYPGIFCALWASSLAIFVPTWFCCWQKGDLAHNPPYFTMAHEGALGPQPYHSEKGESEMGGPSRA